MVAGVPMGNDGLCYVSRVQWPRSFIYFGGESPFLRRLLTVAAAVSASSRLSARQPSFSCGFFCEGAMAISVGTGRATRSPEGCERADTFPVFYLACLSALASRALFALEEIVLDLEVDFGLDVEFVVGHLEVVERRPNLFRP